MADEKTEVVDPPSTPASDPSTDELLYPDGVPPQNADDSTPSEETSGGEVEAKPETDPESETGKSQETGEKNAGLKKRLNQLWAQNKEKEETISRLEAAAAVRVQTPVPDKPAEPGGPPARPEIRNYDLTKSTETERWDKDMAAYETQRDTYQLDQFRTRQQADAQKAQQQTAQQQHQALVSAWMDQGRAKYEDFDQVTQTSGAFVSQHAIDILMGLEHGSDILYNDLAGKPAESQRIGRLPLHEQTAEMMKLHAARNGSRTPVKPNLKKPSGNKPPADVGGTSGVTSKEETLDEIFYPDG